MEKSPYADYAPNYLRESQQVLPIRCQNSIYAISRPGRAWTKSQDHPQAAEGHSGVLENQTMGGWHTLTELLVSENNLPKLKGHCHERH
jgi:hypothetical protein